MKKNDRRPGRPTGPFRHGASLVFEKLLRWVVHPRLRARLLALAGAHIGTNVRIYEIRLVNLEMGFRNLTIEDDVHVGPACILDLKGRLRLREGAVLSPRVMVMTHRDPGTSHQSPLALRYPAQALGVEIGPYSWIGAGAIILDGCNIGANSVIGAGALVCDHVPENVVAVGVPARPSGPTP